MRNRCTCRQCGRSYPPTRGLKILRRGGRRKLVPRGKPRCVGWCKACLDRMIEELNLDG